MWLVFLHKHFNLKRVLSLLYKDLSIDFRQKHIVSGILLFLCTTVFIVYKAFAELRPETWNVLFWILFLFVSLNGILKSFVQENSQRNLYYYSIFDASHVIISKLIYNFLFSVILAFVLFILMSFLTVNPIKDMPLFVMILLSAVYGVSTVFTFVSALSSVESQGGTLMAILAFPIVLPILLLALKISAQALGILNDTTVNIDFTYLWAINGMMTGASLILFPLLWKN